MHMYVQERTARGHVQDDLQGIQTSCSLLTYYALISRVLQHKAPLMTLKWSKARVCNYSFRLTHEKNPSSAY